MRYDASNISFGNWHDGVVAGESGLSSSETDFVLNEVLTGTCTYAIAGDQLTITKDGVGALIFTRA